MCTVQVELPPKLIPVFSGEADVRGAWGGRGSGKTRSFAKMTAIRALMWDRTGREGSIVCGRQFMNSLDDSSMEEVKAAIRSEPWLLAEFEIGEKFIRTRSRRISYKFVGLDRSLDSIKSKSRILLCWVDEAEPVTEEAWVKLIPTLREEDSELWVTWNPESKRSPTHKRFREGHADPRVRVAEINWRDNPWFPAVLERTRQRDLRDRPEKYPHIWDGAFSEVFEGAYYTPELLAAQQQGRIGTVEHEPILPVHTVWDLGKGAHMAIWLFQIDGGSIRVLEYLQGTTDEGIPSLVAKLNAKPYRYGIDWVPHDAKVKEIGTERTRIETFQRLKRNPKLVPDHRVRDGINAVKETLPRCWFNEEDTDYGLDALRQYRSDYNEDKMHFSDEPRKDWTNHAADAFRYLAMAWREMKAEAPPPPKKDALIYEVDAAGQLRPNMTVREIIELKRRKQRAANE